MATSKYPWKLRFLNSVHYVRTRALPAAVIGLVMYLAAFNIGMRWWKGPDQPINRLQWQLRKAEGKLSQESLEKENVITQYYTTKFRDASSILSQWK